MENQLVLKTTENDIQEFYVDILGGKITKHFPLNLEDAIKRFNIPQPLEVYELELQDMQFKLCPYEALEQDSLQHMNLHLKGASDKFMKAFAHNYWTSLRRKDGREIYFIKDKNYNLFELEN